MSIQSFEDDLTRKFASASPLERARFALAVAERHWFWLGGEGDRALAALRTLDINEGTRESLQAELRRAATIANDPDRFRASDEVGLYRLLDAALTGEVLAVSRAAIATHGKDADGIAGEIEALSKLAGLQVEPTPSSPQRPAASTPPRAPTPPRAAPPPASPPPAPERAPAPSPAPRLAPTREREARKDPLSFEAVLGVSVDILETSKGSRRFRVLVDGAPCRLRVRMRHLDIDELRPGSHDWVEGDEADLTMLVDRLDSRKVTRRQEGRSLILEENLVGLSGFDADVQIVVTLVAPGLLEVDMLYRVNPENPYVGW